MKASSYQILVQSEPGFAELLKRHNATIQEPTELKLN
jgi:hypothetical protein